jgi:hypothetical protein
MTGRSPGHARTRNAGHPAARHSIRSSTKAVVTAIGRHRTFTLLPSGAGRTCPASTGRPVTPTSILVTSPARQPQADEAASTIGGRIFSSIVQCSSVLRSRAAALAGSPASRVTDAARRAARIHTAARIVRAPVERGRECRERAGGPDWPGPLFAEAGKKEASRRRPLSGAAADPLSFRAGTACSRGTSA